MALKIVLRGIFKSRAILIANPTLFQMPSLKIFLELKTILFLLSLKILLFPNLLMVQELP